MQEELKGLIEKIQKEGVQAAQSKARAIEEEAKTKSQNILETAQNTAEKLIREAKEKIENMEAASQANLKQAARDLLISLRKEINAVLKRLILEELHKALGPQELASSILALIKSYKMQESGEVVVSLSERDFAKLEKEFLGKLKAELKGNITLKPREDIQAGFTLSFDAGKSCYDFSDTALADYLSLRLEPKLAEALKSAKPSINPK